MSKQIGIKFLRAQVDRLNRITGNPMASYVQTDGKYVAQIGNYHLSGAYGGHSLNRMENESGGISDVFRSGHISKRELSNRIDSFILGIKATQSNKAA